MGEVIWRVRGGYVGGTFGKVGSGGHAVYGVHGGLCRGEVRWRAISVRFLVEKREK